VLHTFLFQRPASLWFRFTAVVVTTCVVCDPATAASLSIVNPTALSSSVHPSKTLGQEHFHEEAFAAMLVWVHQRLLIDRAVASIRAGGSQLGQAWGTKRLQWTAAAGLALLSAALIIHRYGWRGALITLALQTSYGLLLGIVDQPDQSFPTDRLRKEIKDTQRASRKEQANTIKELKALIMLGAQKDLAIESVLHQLSRRAVSIPKANTLEDFRYQLKDTSSEALRILHRAIEYVHARLKRLQTPEPGGSPGPTRPLEPTPAEIAKAKDELLSRLSAKLSSWQKIHPEMFGFALRSYAQIAHITSFQLPNNVGSLPDFIKQLTPSQVSRLTKVIDATHVKKKLDDRAQRFKNVDALKTLIQKAGWRDADEFIGFLREISSGNKTISGRLPWRIERVFRENCVRDDLLKEFSNLVREIPKPGAS
jgi:hypothetical protein